MGTSVRDSSREELSVESSKDWSVFAPPSLARDLRVADAALPSGATFSAAVLFADISGFTTLAARMAERGVAGTEELTQRLNACFGTMLRTVSEAGGDVEKFAGDAMVAVFRVAAGEASAAGAALRAAGCALAMIEAIDAQETDDVRLSVHAGVGAGTIRTRHVELEDGARVFILSGDALEQAAGAQGAAKDREACLSPEAHALVAPNVETTDTGRGFPKLSKVGPRPAASFEDGATSRRVSPAISAYLNRVLVERSREGQDMAWLAELRRATVLFVSLGSPDGTDIDDARLAAAARVIGRNVARFDGLLHDLIDDDKGLVSILLFGVRNAHEDDAARGVQAALDLGVRLAEVGVVPSIGVTTGRVYSGVIGSATRKELAVIGDAMNLAARLMGAAKGGVLCSDATRKDAANRFAFEAVHGLKLKNVAPGFVAYRPAHAGRAVGPVSIRGSSIVGREREWAALSGAADEHVAAREFRGVVALGEAGIGKSALVRQLQLRFESSPGARLVRLAGDAIDQVSPYHAWREAAVELLDVDVLASPEQQRAAIEDKLAALPELAPFAPVLAELVPHAPPETPRTTGLEPQARAERVRDIVLALVALRAELGPLLLVVEDAHWFDSASWALVQQLATRQANAMVLVSSRPPSGDWQGRLDAFTALPKVVTLEIGPLSQEASAALVRAKLGVKSLSPNVESLIFERAAGHPFFTEELALALRDAGLLRVERDTCMLATSDRDHGGVAVPDTLERVLTSRIDSQREPERLSLKVASVLGRDFAKATLRAVFPGDVRALDGSLDALCSAELLVDCGDGQMRFKHALTRDVGYSLLPFKQRRELHRSVAEHLEAHEEADRAGHVAHLAHHWGFADAPARAMPFAEEAGRHALSRFANREAVHFYREAMRFQAAAAARVTPQRIAQWESDLGLAHRALGELDESKRKCESALSRLSHTLPAKTPRARLGLVAYVLRMFATRPRLVPGQVPDPAAATALNAYMQLARIAHYANDIETMMFNTAHAVPLAKKAGATIEVATLYGSVAHMAAFAKVFPASRAFARGAHAIADVVKTSYCRGTVNQFTGHLAGCLGDLETLDHDMHVARDSFAELGPGRPLEEALTNLGYLYQFKGDLPRSMEAMSTLERSGRARDDVQTTGWGIVGQGRVFLFQGELEAALARLDAAESIVSDSLTMSELFGNRALVHFRCGDVDAALADAAKTITVAEDNPATSYTTLPGYSATMEVLVLACFMGRADRRVSDGRSGTATVRELAVRMHKAFVKYAKLFPVAEPQRAVWDGVMLAVAGRGAKAATALERALKKARASQLKDDEAMATRWLAGVQRGSERRASLRRAAEKFAATGRTYEATEAREASEGSRVSKTIAPWEGMSS